VLALGCNGRGQGHVTHILKFWSSSNIFGISEAEQFKFRVPTDTEEYYCKHDRVSPKRCLGSHKQRHTIAKGL